MDSPYRLKRHLRRRSAIEPEIGHMKGDGLLGRNFLKGMQGDAINGELLDGQVSA
jgi:IS5 family transposase